MFGWVGTWMSVRTTVAVTRLGYFCLFLAAHFVLYSPNIVIIYKVITFLVKTTVVTFWASF